MVSKTMKRSVSGCVYALCIFFTIVKASPTPTAPTFMGCGGNLTTPKGSFSSPNFPLPYPSNSRCEWHIHTTPPNVILVDFSIFRLENPSLITGICDYDVLHVMDGASRDKVIASFCGSVNPGPIISSSSTISFVFLSDESVSHQGFNATYTTGPAPTHPPITTPRAVCGTSITSDHSWIASPGYPSKYQNLLDCTYIIHLETPGKIAMELVDIDIESGSACQYDYLEVRDGDTKDAELLGRYCGTSAGRIIGTSNALHLRFVTDESVSKRGFNATWSKASCKKFGGTCIKDCKGTISSLECPDGQVCCHLPTLPEVCGISAVDPMGTTAPSTYIVGGQEAIQHAWPWQVSLQAGSYHYCGGSLIASQWVLTSAHCVFQMRGDVDVILGEHDLDAISPSTIRVRASKVVLHESFKSDAPYPDNVALLKLPEPVKVGKMYMPVCIPEEDQEFTPDTECYMTGWGRTKGSASDRVLNQIRMSPRLQSECRESWGPNYILPTHICAGNGDKGACKGDYGGPLMCKVADRWVLAGISSWGKVSCQEEGFPTVCTRVSRYRQWIMEKIATE